MRIDVLTLFPEMFEGVFGTSILGKAAASGKVQLNTVNFREFATNKHKTVDDAPYGGGGGMVLQPEPIFAAVESLCGSATSSQPRILLMCPQGEPFTQKKAEELAQEDHLIIICGHYEGVDERVRQHLVTDEISIGDYVLTGGEIPAMVIADSVVRLLPGVLGNETSAVTDSFSTGYLEYPQYTRPAVFRGWAVPEVLLSGHHERIEKWRRKQSLLRTWQRRPDLIDADQLNEEERMWLKQFKEQECTND